MSGTSRIPAGVKVVLATILFVLTLAAAGITVLTMNLRAEERNFEAKLRAAGYSASIDAERKDENECTKRDKKTRKCTQYKTLSELDAPTVVGNCPLQLESPNGKTYKLDEVNLPGGDPDGIDTTDGAAVPAIATAVNPTRIQVYDYLERNKGVFTCFKPNAGKN